MPHILRRLYRRDFRRWCEDLSESDARYFERFSSIVNADVLEILARGDVPSERRMFRWAERLEIPAATYRLMCAKLHLAVSRPEYLGIVGTVTPRPADRDHLPPKTDTDSDRYFLIDSAVHSWRHGNLCNLLTSNNRRYLSIVFAAIVFGRTFESVDEFNEAVLAEQWDGWEIYAADLQADGDD
jgi:hypothetical protein